MKDSNRLHQLNCKRLSPPSCGGGELNGADDEEEALLTARLAAYQHGPEGRDRALMFKLMFKRGRLSVDEQHELDRLKAKYPEAPKKGQSAGEGYRTAISGATPTFKISGARLQLFEK